MIVIYILITLLILTVLVVIHEGGHYFVAKKCGVYVMEFAVGMGPKLFSRYGKETMFSIRAIPIGGFCLMYGEDDAQDQLDDYLLPADLDESRSFAHLPKGKKIAVFAAGPLMNLITAFVLIFLVRLFVGAGPLNAFVQSFQITGEFCVLIIQSFIRLFTGQAALSDFSGPIGMVTMVGDMFAYGVYAMMMFAALISANLGMINLFPFPALDGGQIVIALIEKISGKTLSSRFVGKLNFVGFAALMIFAAVIAVNDIFKLIG